MAAAKRHVGCAMSALGVGLLAGVMHGPFAPFGAAMGAVAGYTGAREAANEAESRKHWLRVVHAALGGAEAYHQVATVVLWQMRLLVFVRADLAPLVRGVTEDSRATGALGGKLANKGGISVRLLIGGTSVAFVACHLAAHEPNVKERNEQAAELLRSLHSGEHGAPLTVTTDHVVLLGDLNYRVDSAAVLRNERMSPSAGSAAVTTPSPHPPSRRSSGGAGAAESDEEPAAGWARVTRLIADGRWEELLEDDQLTTEMAAGRVFSGFREATVTFAPTFKRVRGVVTDDASVGPDAYVKKRVPAWCDRVLHASRRGCAGAFAVTDYTACPAVTTSDHVPVFATFSLLPGALSSLTGRRAAVWLSSWRVEDVRGGSLPEATASGSRSRGSSGHQRLMDREASAHIYCPGSDGELMDLYFRTGRVSAEVDTSVVPSTPAAPTPVRTSLLTPARRPSGAERDGAVLSWAWEDDQLPRLSVGVPGEVTEHGGGHIVVAVVLATGGTLGHCAVALGPGLRDPGALVKFDAVLSRGGVNVGRLCGELTIGEPEDPPSPLPTSLRAS